jgi:hypothetical protein
MKNSLEHASLLERIFGGSALDKCAPSPTEISLSTEISLDAPDPVEAMLAKLKLPAPEKLRYRGTGEHTQGGEYAGAESISSICDLDALFDLPDVDVARSSSQGDLAKASSRRGRIRLEKEIVNGHEWLFRYDHEGVCVGGMPTNFAQYAAAVAEEMN